MASINIDPPVSTPAHEWAADTADALHSTSSAKATQPSNPVTSSAREGGPASVASTPGLDVPGSFPRESRTQTQPSAADDRTPHAAATHLADAAPPKSTAEWQDTARGYLPNVDMQRAVNTARAYLPESVFGAVDSVLPASMANGTQTEKNLDPPSGAKPAAAAPLSPGSTTLDNASTTALPSSTRTGSYTSNISGGGVRTPSVGPNAELGNTLDQTSTAKPSTTATDDSSGIPINSTSSTSAAPVPGASSKTTSSRVNAANTAIAMHTLPTPPASKDISPATSNTSSAHPPGLSTSASQNAPDSAFPSSNGVSRVAGSDANVAGSKQGPAPPPKDESSSHEKENTKEAADASQPTVNTTPGQDHVMGGAAMRARVPGTAPVGGDGAHSPVSPKSSLSDAHLRDDGETGGATVRTASGTASSSEGSVGGKKEGRVKGLVHKVKDKLSHHGH